MARFNPEHYPDRLAFEAHAKRIRGQEIDRLFGAARTWFGAMRAELLQGIARPVVPGSASARRRVHH